MQALKEIETERSRIQAEGGRRGFAEGPVSSHRTPDTACEMGTPGPETSKGRRY